MDGPSAIEASNSAISLLKNTIVAFFNLAKLRAKPLAKAENNNVRCYFGIASLR